MGGIEKEMDRIKYNKTGLLKVNWIIGDYFRREKRFPLLERVL